MGEYKLVPDPNANNPALVQTWIDQFNALQGHPDRGSPEMKCRLLAMGVAR